MLNKRSQFVIVHHIVKFICHIFEVTLSNWTGTGTGTVLTWGDTLHGPSWTTLSGPKDTQSGLVWSTLTTKMDWQDTRRPLPFGSLTSSKAKKDEIDLIGQHYLFCFVKKLWCARASRQMYLLSFAHFEIAVLNRYKISWKIKYFELVVRLNYFLNSLSAVLFLFSPVGSVLM